MSTCFEYIKKDLYRYTGNVSLKSFCKQYFHRGEGFRFSVWLRICHFSYNHLLYRYLIFPYARFKYRKYRYMYGIDIGYDIEIGPGMLIYHFGTIVFRPSVCGKNVTLSHGITVGMKVINGKQYYPSIGDNLYMAPGSSIVGNVRVGDNVCIGTNSVVLKSVDNNSVVVGTPGKVVSTTYNNEYLENIV